MKKLIIWDFDGVISDTEKLWIETRRDLLNKYYKLNWTFEDTNKYLGGMSDATKKEVLKELNIEADDKFWNEALSLDIKKLECGIALTDGIEEIFKNKNYDQCIATGGVWNKTQLKIKAVNIAKYFDNHHIFTADMVKKGKPNPDLFLLAAEKMGYMPEDCIIIEDSIAGMTAGLKAGMMVVAFLGCDMNNNEKYEQQIRKLGIKHIFFNMKDISNFLDKQITPQK